MKDGIKALEDKIKIIEEVATQIENVLDKMNNGIPIDYKEKEHFIKSE